MEDVRALARHVLVHRVLTNFRAESEGITSATIVDRLLETGEGVSEPARPSLLDPALLARLGTLKLRVRSVTEGILSGLHRSPHHGQSVEFAEHKEYAPGDDVRRIDWKAYGKFDKYYVKQFEQETNLRCYLVVDTSGSMGWTRRRGAAHQAGVRRHPGRLARLPAGPPGRRGRAGALRAGGGPVAAAGRHRRPPAPLLDALESARAEGPTRLGAAVDWVVEHAPRRSAVVILSDLFDPDEGIVKRLAQLPRRKHDVTLFHVLDPAELEFPFEEPTLFLSMEDGRSVEANGRDVKAGYLEVFHGWLAAVKREAAEADVDYTLCRTDRPLDEVLLPFLARRERRAA